MSIDVNEQDAREQLHNEATQRDRDYIKQMQSLKEEVLLKKFFVYFFLPSIVISTLAIFFPFVYASLAV